MSDCGGNYIFSQICHDLIGLINRKNGYIFLLFVNNRAKSVDRIEKIKHFEKKKTRG
jgi:hypothetical protein